MTDVLDFPEYVCGTSPVRAMAVFMVHKRSDDPTKQRRKLCAKYDLQLVRRDPFNLKSEDRLTTNRSKHVVYRQFPNIFPSLVTPRILGYPSKSRCNLSVPIPSSYISLLPISLASPPHSPLSHLFFAHSYSSRNNLPSHPLLPLCSQHLLRRRLARHINNNPRIFRSRSNYRCSFLSSR